MSRVYDSLKGVVQRNKSNPVALVRVKGNSALTVNDEMEELERIVLDRIARLKAAVNEGEAVVAGEVQHAEQLIDSLKENITTLEAKGREAEDTIRRKDSASQRMEESLTAKIHDLQNDVKKKNEARLDTGLGSYGQALPDDSLFNSGTSAGASEGGKTGK